MTMEQLIGRYIYKEVDKLRYKNDSVELQCVFPNIITDTLEGDVLKYEAHGGSNYLIEMNKYKIEGTMKAGTAKVTLIEDRIK